ncbi:MAG: hypothetical protein SLAVMIC_00520 [uncultured marine phage]|uniref:Uncharacterized protein n=1 Tax=uncultured marine phage TaxID=707152 RepID=A0A8D9CBP4_9VIRU|nr:MAG: hypothetical protein SLAVMIC_00520 [uncultured marine phage]
MNIEKGRIICLRKDYVEYYNRMISMEDPKLKLTKNKVVVKNINKNNKIFPYVVTDQHNETHNLGGEDIDYGKTKSLRVYTAFINPLKNLKIYSELK